MKAAAFHSRRVSLPFLRPLPSLEHTPLRQIAEQHNNIKNSSLLCRFLDLDLVPPPDLPPANQTPVLIKKNRRGEQARIAGGGGGERITIWTGRQRRQFCSFFFFKSSNGWIEIKLKPNTILLSTAKTFENRRAARNM